MTAIACASLIATTFTGSGGAVSERAWHREKVPLTEDTSTLSTGRAQSARSETCTYAHHRQLMRAVRFYSWKLRNRLAKMGAGQFGSSPVRKELSKGNRPGNWRTEYPAQPCPRYLAKHLRSQAYALRKAHKRWLRRLTDPEAAIEHVFGEYAWQAKAVAWCESRMSVWASNGQYLGLFQMGEFARERYGHGFSALAQARAAFRYFVASGRDWSPWTCKP